VVDVVTTVGSLGVRWLASRHSVRSATASCHPTVRRDASQSSGQHTLLQSVTSDVIIEPAVDGCEVGLASVGEVMSDIVDVQCPACGHVTEVAPEWVGRQARCRCGFTFVVPAGAPEIFEPDAFEPDDQKPGASDLQAHVDSASVAAEPPKTTYHPAPTRPRRPNRPATVQESQGEFEPDTDRGDVPGFASQWLDPGESILMAGGSEPRAVAYKTMFWAVAWGAPLGLLTLASLLAGNPGGVCVGSLVLGAIAAGILVKRMFWLQHAFVVTDRRTLTHCSGIIPRTQSAWHRHVVSIELERRLVDRWAETETFRLQLAGGGWRNRVTLRHVANADQLVALLGRDPASHDELL